MENAIVILKHFFDSIWLNIMFAECSAVVVFIYYFKHAVHIGGEVKVLHPNQAFPKGGHIIVEIHAKVSLSVRNF